MMMAVVRHQPRVKGMAWNHIGNDSQCHDIGHGNFVGAMLSNLPCSQMVLTTLNLTDNRRVVRPSLMSGILSKKPNAKMAVECNSRNLRFTQDSEIMS